MAIDSKLLTINTLEKMASSAGFSKALALKRSNAVAFAGKFHGGPSVNASVQSETGAQRYEVWATRSAAGWTAKCTCWDFKRNQRLCKHGIATVLCIAERENPTIAFPDKGAPSTGASATPENLQRAKLAGKVFPELSPAKRPRLSTPPPAKVGASHPLRFDSDSDNEEGYVGEHPAAVRVEAPAPTPVFPKSPATSAVPQAPRTKKGLRSSMAARLLRAAAASGDAAILDRELQRWGQEPLDDVLALLHRAILGNRADGAASVVRALVARREVQAVLSAPLTGVGYGGDGRTPLHAAVDARRPEICRILLEHGADVAAEDAKGRTPLQWARAAKLDFSAGRRTNPIVELLQSHQAKRS